MYLGQCLQMQSNIQDGMKVCRAVGANDLDNR